MALAYMLLLAYYNVFGINYTEWQLHLRYVFKVGFFLVKTRKAQLFFQVCGEKRDFLELIFRSRLRWTLGELFHFLFKGNNKKLNLNIK